MVKKNGFVYIRLKIGDSKSCCCLHKELAKIRQTKDSESVLFTQRWCHTKATARDRNLEFSLNKEEFKILVNSNCYYCNAIPSNIEKVNRGGKIIYESKFSRNR